MILMSKEINTDWLDAKFTGCERFVINALFRDRIDSMPDDCDEDVLFQYVSQNGVAPSFYKIFHKQEDSFSRQFMLKLRNEYLKTLVVNTNLVNKAQEIFSLLNNEGIHVTFLKGILLAPFLYEELPFRPMSDIDLLIPEKDIEKAYDLLLANGAEKADPAEKDVPSNHHLPMIMFKSAPVEVHRFLFPQHSDYFIPPQDILANSMMWSDGAVSLPGPSCVDAFIYMAVHVYYTFLRGGMRLSWMNDFHLFRKQGERYVDVESQEFNATVKKWNVEYPLRFILAFERLLSGDEPENKEWRNDKKLMQDISLATEFLRETPKDSVLFSYRLIWEQIRNTKGVSAKMNILKSKLFRRSDQEGFVKRSGKLSVRFAGMIFNSTKLFLKRLTGRY